VSVARLPSLSLCHIKNDTIELQGHAIKNQDILIASGAMALKGSDGMTDLEEDIQAVRRL
jgi:hypothetical protein